MTTVSTLPRLRTPGVIARELGESLQRVQYVLRTRPNIKPAALAGQLRLYDRQAVAQVRHELNAIDARRTVQQIKDEAARRRLDLRTGEEIERDGRQSETTDAGDTPKGVTR
jgi:hypothetical protein